MTTRTIAAVVPAPRTAGDVAPRRRKRPRRDVREVADRQELTKAAAVAAREAALRAELEAVHAERLAIVARLRVAGLSHLEIAELLSITKARVQQLCHEARAAGYDLPSG